MPALRASIEPRSGIAEATPPETPMDQRFGGGPALALFVVTHREAVDEGRKEATMGWCRLPDGWVAWAVGVSATMLIVIAAVRLASVLAAPGVGPFPPIPCFTRPPPLPPP